MKPAVLSTATEERARAPGEGEDKEREDKVVPSCHVNCAE